MKRSTQISLLAGLIACGLTAHRAAAEPMPVQSASKDASGVTIKLQKGLIRLEVCNDRTIRVRSTPQDALPDKRDFVIDKKFGPADFKWDEQGDKLVLSTDKMGVEVDRATGALTFVDAEGKTLLEEPTDGGRTFKEIAIPTGGSEARAPYFQIQQTFLSPRDEHLYGLAEAQDGTWDWRGMPIELRQLNTQAALPVMISSRGYGLLWDNASLTDFNPVDQEIKLSTSNDNSAGGPTATEQLGRGRRGMGRATGPRTGTFTTGEGGEYVFFAKDGDRRNQIGIVVNGKTIVNIQNMWVPYTTAGKVLLPANTEVKVELLGGGRDAKLFARPLGNTTTFRSHTARDLDYTFFYGPDLDSVVDSYRTATGAAPMWPLWAYGFWQCRERYSSQQQILDTVAEFRKREIPIDLIVQDWQYWGPHGWGAYEWDNGPYPEPAKMISSLHDQNVRFMISVWSNPQGKAGADLKAHNDVVPGTDWVDAFKPEARELRWKWLNDTFYSIGTDAWWQDATEPGDDGNGIVGKPVGWGAGDLFRNAYPLVANQTVYEGQRATAPDKRVVTLTRSSFPGQQRYASALWSGDIAGDWITFRRQIPAGLNVCLTGLPYWTTDCGGFFRPRDQYQSDDFADLLTRWFQYSTFCPIQRMHGYQSETEFWKFPKAEKNLVAYDRFRHRLLPYIYSLAWSVTHNNDTMMRALPMDFAGDPKVWEIDDEYMFGRAFLVSPITEPQAVARTVYLPAKTAWTSFWTGESIGGGIKVDTPAPENIIPLYLRAGSIVPMGPDVQYAGEKPADPLEVRVYPGADGSFTLYEDEGDTYNYEKGAYATIPMKWDEATQTLTIGKREGEFPGMLKERKFNVVFVRPGHGIGMEAIATPDVVVPYSGDAVRVSMKSKSVVQ